MRTTLKIIALVFSIQLSPAQETLRPLRGNPALVYKQAAVSAPSEEKQPQNYTARQQTTSLQLPFKEDFYYATTSAYPRQDLWMDSLVYINTGFPIDPLSIGVATFDGLGKNGFPHEPNVLSLIVSRPADTLTSRPINLKVAGSTTLIPESDVALIFYYQMGGKGENPDGGDSLMVEFYSPEDSVWTKVWSQRGNVVPNKVDSVFHRVFLRIDTAYYLQDGFQFRFRNRATPSGNFDHWHVDYIYLDRNLHEQDTVFDDLTFAYPSGSLLREYSAMPHNQYRPSEMSDKMPVWIRNNRLGVINMSYEHKVYSETWQQAHAYQGGPTNLGAFHLTGYDSVPAHANFSPASFYTLAVQPAHNSNFYVKHIVYRNSTALNEFFAENDTMVQIQRFHDYYAFDDGGAEAGYFLNAPQAKMALRVKLNERDTLRGLRIYFDPVGKIAESRETGFRILVWSSAGPGPAAVQHSFSTVHFQKYYNVAGRELPYYPLDAPLVLEAGTYFIGIQQQANPVTVGFDRNYDSSNSLYFSTKDDNWQKSSFSGSLMLRPVFGRSVVAGLEKMAANKKNFVFYPNPAAQQLRIEALQTENFSYAIVNALGQPVLAGTATGSTSLDVSELKEGIYFAIIQTGSSAGITHKLIISR